MICNLSFFFHLFSAFLQHLLRAWVVFLSQDWDLYYLVLKGATVSRILVQVELNNESMSSALRCAGGGFKEQVQGAAA